MLSRRRYSRGYSGIEDAPLETDIMRFMAILGFCLMVVFALIQSIPQSSGMPSVAMQSKTLLLAELAALETQLTARRDAVATQEAHLQALQEELQQHSIAKDRLANESEQLARQTRQLQLDSAALAADFNRVAARLANHAQTLDALRARVTTEQATLRDLDAQAKSVQRRIEDEEVQLSTLQTRAAALAARQQAQPADIASAPAPKAPPSSAARTGLTMRFDSSAAISALVASGAVELFAVTGNRAWRANRSGTTFVAAGRPNNELYELTDEPGRQLVERFRHSSGVLGVKPRWLVELDVAIEDQVAAFIRNGATGELIIQRTQRVVHVP